MTRLIQEKVDQVIEELLAKGKKPTLRAVRDALGTGSYSTVLACVQVWKENHESSVSEKRTILPVEKVGPNLDKHLRWVFQNKMPLFVSRYSKVNAILTLEEPSGASPKLIKRVDAMENWPDLFDHIAVKKSRWVFRARFEGEGTPLIPVYLLPVPKSQHFNVFNEPYREHRMALEVLSQDSTKESSTEELQDRLEELSTAQADFKNRILAELAAISQKIEVAFAGPEAISQVTELSDSQRNDDNVSPPDTA